MHFVTVLAGLLLFGGSACARSGGPPVTRDPAIDPNVLTSGEIAQAQGVTTAWDAVNRLRPRYLRIGGPKSPREVDSAPVVKVDEGPFSALSSLRDVDATLIREIRYYSALDATQRFGGLNARPVIQVITKTRGAGD